MKKLLENISNHRNGDAIHPPAQGWGFSCNANHKELLDLIERHIKKPFMWDEKGCKIRPRFYARELHTEISFEPDFFIWAGSSSIQLEAKVSLADYRKEHKKIYRRIYEPPLYHYYYIVAPPELAQELMWYIGEGCRGLISCDEKSFKILRHSIRNTPSKDASYVQSAILLSMLRRAGVKCYGKNGLITIRRKSDD